MKFSSFFLLFLIWAAAPLKSQPVMHEQNIFPLQDKHVHGSSIVACPNGDLLACWFHGSGERTADDVLIQGARFKKGAKKWSPVFIMADTPGFPDCNPALFIDQKNRLWIFWIAVLAHRWEKSLLMYRIAEHYQKDGAPDWTWQGVINLKPGKKFAETLEKGMKKLFPEEPMWAEYAPPYPRLLVQAAQDPAKRQMGWMTRLHPTVLPSGRILLPLYSDGFNISLVAISDDLGKNWRASLPIVGLGPTQPSIVGKKDGTLVAYLRDSGNPPFRIMRSVSKDDGESWSVAGDTELPNPDSSLEAVVLKDGRWVMVYNDTEDNRYSIAAAVSADEGASWKWKRHLGRAMDGSKSFAYPSLIQTRDGLLHLTCSYSEQGGASIKHFVFSVDWVTQK